MKKNKFIIITSIFKPTKAVKAFVEINTDWQLIVVGDKKTPENWNFKNVIYLSPSDQEKLDYEIIKLLPWNHYSRKMIGYLYAMSLGAEIIYDTDDDNIPLKSWREPAFEGKFSEIISTGIINTYSLFTDKKIWPRGLLLKDITSKKTLKTKANTQAHIGIWQFLADGDPDVDAIYRLTDNSPVKFNKKCGPFVLNKDVISPINSQNTFFKKEVFELLYLPAFVTFRFTDILRGFVAQPILWQQNLKVGFGTATVFQERNPHNYIKDFESEIPMYLQSEKVVDIAKKISSEKQAIDTNLTNIYLELNSNNIVSEKEVQLLKAWLSDISKIKNK